jgi:hypothetical protein
MRMLQGINMGRVDPNGGNGNAIRFQGSVDLLCSRLAVAYTVEREAIERVCERFGGEREFLRRHDRGGHRPLVFLR